MEDRLVGEADFQAMHRLILADRRDQLHVLVEQLLGGGWGEKDGVGWRRWGEKGVVRVWCGCGVARVSVWVNGLGGESCVCCVCCVCVRRSGARRVAGGGAREAETDYQEGGHGCGGGHMN